MGMPARRLLRFAPLVAVAGLLLYEVASLPPREPRYGGKPLHYWLPRIHNERLPTGEQDKTRAAILCIGTNNLPLLLEWFREEEPPDAEPAYYKAINWLLSRQRLTRFRLEATYRWSRPSMAYAVFTWYPEVAEIAIPQFIAMLNDKELLTKGKAGMVLGNIGKPAIPALLTALSQTNDTARAIAAYHLGEIGTNAIHVRPNLEAMLSDKTIFVRLNAAGAVGKLGGDPEIIVPVLLQCFHEGDDGTRSYALDFLSKLKERAKSAVPDLIYSLAAATNSNDHYSLLGALREIDSEQAAKFEPPRPVSTSEPPPEESAANPGQLIAPGQP
jgi:HEAT repeat protein